MGLGRLVPHKRFDLAVKAWEQVRPHVGGRLVIAGKGPELERLRSMAGPGVELPGRITEQEKLDLLASAWLMVHPASHEGWGLVITEAAAYGTPSLAFRVPGLRDSIVDGMSGILVDRPEELAATWLRIAQDPALRAQLEGVRSRLDVVLNQPLTEEQKAKIVQPAEADAAPPDTPDPVPAPATPMSPTPSAATPTTAP